MANYDETLNGELSDNPDSPTVLTLTPGDNIVTGSTTSGNPDFFTFEVPEGSTVSAVFLQAYTGPDGSYFALDDASSFSTVLDDSNFVISTLIDDGRTLDAVDQPSEVGLDLLEPGVGNNPGDPAGPPIITGTGELGPGTYSIWYQELAGDTTYAFNIVLDTPPTPGQIQFSSNTFQVDETTGTVDVILTRTDGSSGAVSVVLSQTGGTAQNSVDYNIVTPLTVNFADGETQQVVSVAIVNDVLVEGNESVLFELTDPTGGATLGATTASTLTIVDEDQFFSGTGDPDTLRGGAGGDKILGLGGDDRLVGKEGNDRLFGGSDDDRLIGGEGNDRLFGGSGDDRLIGGEGNDRLFGGSGDDVLDGGIGSDTLVGGADRDIFVLRLSDGSDLIRDFQLDEDLLDLRGGLQFGQLTITQAGTRAIISVNSDQLAVLRGVQADQLTASQFI